jgi:phosphate-selective porin OprO and OprP
MARQEPLPAPNGAEPAARLESRLRELEQQFDEQRFQLEVMQQSLNDERAARAAAARQAAEAAAAQAQAAKQGYVVGSNPNMRAVWLNGLTFESPNKDFWFHIGGRTQLDGVWLQAPNNALQGAGGVGASDAVDFRRARLRAEGTMHDVVDWCVEYNFVGAVNLSTGTPASPSSIANVPSPTDLWWNFRRVPVLNNLTIGNIKEPFGLERLESSRFLDFMERSYNQDAFIAPSNNGFAPGILTWNYDRNRRWTYAAGIFKNVLFTPFAFGVGDGDYAADGRVTLAPYYDEASNGRYLVHVGLGGSWRENQDGQIRFRSRGALRNGPDALNPILADTGVYRSHAEGILVPEAAVVWGPWLFQAEYAATWATQSVTTANVPVGTTFYNGYYVEALYFLTGEHRLYDFQKGLFGRVIPFENAAFVRGSAGRPVFLSGAWQLGVRYNALNLDSKAINGGQLHNVTLGLNWFLNPNMKLQWNVILTHRDGQNNTADANIYGFGMRLAHDF